MEREDRSAPPQEILDVNGHPLAVGEFYYITKKNRRRDDKSLLKPHFGDDTYIRFDDLNYYNGKNYDDLIRARYIGQTSTSLKFVEYVPATKKMFYIKKNDFLRYKQGLRNRSSETKFTLELTERPASYTPYLNKHAFDINGDFDFRKQEYFKFRHDVKGIRSGIGEIYLDENGHPESFDEDGYEELGREIGRYNSGNIYVPIPKIEDEVGVGDLDRDLISYERAHGKTKRRKNKKRRTKHKKRRN
jgi:hypothetical protein